MDFTKPLSKDSKGRAVIRIDNLLLAFYIDKGRDAVHQLAQPG